MVPVESLDLLRWFVAVVMEAAVVGWMSRDSHAPTTNGLVNKQIKIPNATVQRGQIILPTYYMTSFVMTMIAVVWPILRETVHLAVVLLLSEDDLDTLLQIIAEASFAFFWLLQQTFSWRQAFAMKQFE